ncbi:MAG: hypothetical protein DRR08_31255 [Candidatus Parabeggiatoa sp. nov. 2]|nr:MAG: hypothetical protein B6247_13790 [Beggiatoa sp. 4572_84]RKZ49096.1 MAG: hypothetical protein DRR08_31255 [Gammaproteobacteria bacterium]
MIKFLVSLGGVQTLVWGSPNFSLAVGGVQTLVWQSSKFGAKAPTNLGAKAPTTNLGALSAYYKLRRAQRLLQT